jgi:hypothetical protein
MFNAFSIVKKLFENKTDKQNNLFHIPAPWSKEACRKHGRDLKYV